MSARLRPGPVTVVLPDLWTLSRRFTCDRTTMPHSISEMLSCTNARSNVNIDAEFSQGFPSWDVLDRCCDELHTMSRNLDGKVKITFKHLTFDVKECNADTGLPEAGDALLRLTKTGVIMGSGAYIRGCTPADVEHIKEFLAQIRPAVETELIPKLIFNVKPKNNEMRQKLQEVFDSTPGYNFKWQKMVQAPDMMKFTL